MFLATSTSFLVGYVKYMFLSSISLVISDSGIMIPPLVLTSGSFYIMVMILDEAPAILETLPTTRAKIAKLEISCIINRRKDVIPPIVNSPANTKLVPYHIIKAMHP